MLKTWFKRVKRSVHDAKQDAVPPVPNAPAGHWSGTLVAQTSGALSQEYTIAKEVTEELWADVHSTGKEIVNWAHTAYSKWFALHQPPPAAPARAPQSAGANALNRPKLVQNRQQLNRSLKLSTAALALSAAGPLISPLFSLAAVPLLMYVSWPVFRTSYRQLRQGNLTVNLMSAITIVLALSLGYVFVASLVQIFLLFSTWLSMKVKDDSRASLVEIFHLQPRTVWVLVNGVEVETPFPALKPGDLVAVHAGEPIPADGVIVEGAASVDQHILTGESQPLEKEAGDTVLASTLLLKGKIQVRVEKAGQDTVVAQIGQILNNTADFKTKTELRAETMANQTVAPTLACSALLLPFIGPIGAASILQAHFRHKLSIASPIAILSYFKRLSRQGILVKDGRTLDLLNDIDIVVFDKTGTLTVTQPHVGPIHICGEYSAEQVLMLAAAAEYKQTHPIAQALLQEAHRRGLTLPAAQTSEYEMGYGLRVLVEEQFVHVGSSRFMAREQIAIPATIETAQTQGHAQGHSLVLVAVEHQLIGAIELLPTVRTEASAAIQALRQQGITEMYIISGDREGPTKVLAQQLGIDGYFAETLPQQKAELIDQLQVAGRKVCYIGDGINDSIALKKAHVSVSLRGASTIAVDTAQIVLLDERLTNLPLLFDTARQFNQNLKTNFNILLATTGVGIAGVLFCHAGLVSITVLNQASLLVVLANALRPTLASQQATAEPATHSTH